MANSYQAEAVYLAGAYAVQQARKAAAEALAAARAVKRAAERAARAVRKAVKVVARVAVTVGKAAYKLSGAQAVVSCATKHDATDCVEAGIAIVTDASIIATGGADIGVVGAEAVAEEGVVDAGAAIGEQGVGAAAETAGAVAKTGEEGSKFDLKDFGTQMLVGGVSGGVGNTIDGYESGYRGGKLAAMAGIGALFGAASNLNVPGGALGTSLLGAGTGLANSVSVQMVGDDSANIGVKGWAFAGVDTVLGAGENAAGYGVTKLGAGTTMGNAMSGVAGLWPSAICGAGSNSHGWDC